MPALRMPAKHEKQRDQKDTTEHKDDADIIQHKLVAVLDEVRVKTERRHVYSSLSWTQPSDNTPLHTNITYEKGANLALGMFCDTSKVASAEASLTAASAKGDETETRSQPRANLLHAMARRRAHLQKIHNILERGYVIPICITDTSAVTELGKFKRWGMDVVASAVRLALF